MYKIYFEDRIIVISSEKKYENIRNDEKYICYKNKKSFYKALQEFEKNTNILKLFVHSNKPKKGLNQFKKKFKIINASGGLVFNKNGGVLMIKRNGVWDLPKGKIEKGEHRKEAAIREVEEECGISGLLIEGKIGRTYHIYKLKKKKIFKTTHWYLMKYKGNEKLIPQTVEGITEVIWKSKEEVKKIIPVTYKNLGPILKEIEKLY